MEETTIIMDRQEIEDIAELKVRRYFDHFLEETLPCILKKHSDSCMHGKQMARWKWTLAGIMLVITSTGTVVGFLKYFL